MCKACENRPWEPDTIYSTLMKEVNSEVLERNKFSSVALIGIELHMAQEQLFISAKLADDAIFKMMQT